MNSDEMTPRAIETTVAATDVTHTCCKLPVSLSAADNSLGGFFSQLFDTLSYPARWNCGAWSPIEGWLHIVSDVAIFLAYFAIPVVLVYFVRKRILAA